MRLILLAAVIALSGCSLFGDRYRDRGQDYLRVDEAANTLDADGEPVLSRDRYPIPELALTPKRPESFILPRPDALQLDTTDDSTSLNEYRTQSLNPRLERDGAGGLILRLDAGFAQAWVAVSDAVAASSLTLSDLNRSTGTWYLESKKVIKAKDRNWWPRLWGKDKHITETYLLKITRARLGVYLSLLTDADNLADEALTTQVLNELSELLAQ